MNRNHLYAVAFAISLIFGSLAFADALDLSQATSEAQKNNPDLQRLKYKRDAAGSERFVALSGHMPHLAVLGTYFFDADYAVLNVNFPGSPQAIVFPQAFPQETLTLQASINIFDGFETINKYRAANEEYGAAENDYDFGTFRLNEMITMRFYEALAAQELAHVAEQNIKTLNQHLDLAKANRRAGVSTNYDVLRIESQLEEAQAEKILDDDNVVIAKRALLEAMGRDTTAIDQVTLEGAMPTPDQKNLPENLHLDIAARQDLQAEAQHETAAERKSSSAKGPWLPRVDFFASTDYYKFGSFSPSVVLNTDGYNTDWSYGLKLTWNIFDGGASWARASEANAAYYAERANHRKQVLASQTDFDMYKRRYTYNAALYHARLRNIDKSQESVRLATIGVKAGTKTHSEVLDAELELFRARAGAIHAQVDAAEAMSSLSLSVGHPVR